MLLPLQVTFREISHSDALERYVRLKASKLDDFCDSIMRCHVVIEVPHRHHRHGKRYHVRIDITVPGDELVVGRNPTTLVHEDIHACIDDAFDDAERVVQDYVRRRRHEVKHHDEPSRGRIAKLFPDEGYGFLKTREGEEVYFHRNSVQNDGFVRLRVGSEVRFAVEDGIKGPQASTVGLTRR